jgi:hypothetical protein
LLDIARSQSRSRSRAEPGPFTRNETFPSRHARGTCWYLAGGCLLAIALLLWFAFSAAANPVPSP